MRGTLLSLVLTDLIAFTENVLRGPQTHVKAPPRVFAELSAEIARRHAQPGAPSRRAAEIMIAALDGFFADQDDAWLMVAGCTLPLLRREAWAALTSERDARADDRIGEYRR